MSRLRFTAPPRNEQEDTSPAHYLYLALSVHQTNGGMDARQRVPPHPADAFTDAAVMQLLQQAGSYHMTATEPDGQ